MEGYEDNVVKGLYYMPNVISDIEQNEILKYLKESTEWINVSKYKNSRRVIHYGYNYAYNRSGITKIGDIPNIFRKLLNIEILKNIIDKENMEQLIINEYKPGQGIANHIDHVKYFGPIIICFTIGSGVIINFTKDSLEKKIYVEPGSMYIMTNDARYKWKHGIKKALYDNGSKRGTRYSLTFRSIK